MRTRPRRPARRGFTLVEMACSVVLMALLMGLVTAAWAAFGVPAIDAYRRGRVAREAMLAAAALAADLGGMPADPASLAGPGGSLGGPSRGRLLDWSSPGGGRLLLCFDGGEEPDGVPSWAAPDVVVAFEADGGALVRRDESSGAEVVVAGDLEQLAALDLGDDPLLGRRLQVELTFRNRTVARTYTFIAIMP